MYYVVSNLTGKLPGINVPNKKFHATIAVQLTGDSNKKYHGVVVPVTTAPRNSSKFGSKAVVVFSQNLPDG